MKFAALWVLAVVALLPQICSSGEYTRRVLPETVEENRAGVIVSVKRSSLSRRIEKFAVKHGADPAIAPELAELLASYEHPRVLAAIAAKESNFRLSARGKAGEVGAFQIIPKHHGHPGYTWSSQTSAADRLLRELLSDTGGRIEPAVRRYNGAGPKAVRYAKSVMVLVRSI